METKLQTIQSEASTNILSLLEEKKGGPHWLAAVARHWPQPQGCKVGALWPHSGDGPYWDLAQLGMVKLVMKKQIGTALINSGEGIGHPTWAPKRYFFFWMEIVWKLTESVLCRPVERLTTELRTGWVKVIYDCTPESFTCRSIQKRLRFDLIWTITLIKIWCKLWCCFI